MRYGKSWTDTLKEVQEQTGVRKVDFVDGITPDLQEAKPEFEVKYASSKKGPIKVTKFMSLKDAKKFLAQVKGEGMNGIISQNGKPVKEEKIECPKCKGEGCEHCDGKGYHMKEEVEIDENDKAMMMKLTTKAMKAIPNSPQQKELIKQVNVYREKLGMKPMREDYSELEESALLQMKMAADDIETYAKKHGGIDKKDMMKTATMLKKGNKKGALKFIKTLDTDPRDYLLKTMGEEENRGPRTDAEKKAHLDKIFKHIDNVRKKKEAKLGFKITDVTPKGYGPTDEAKGDSCWDGYKKVGMKKKGGRMVPNCVPEETNLERLKKTLAIHKFKKGGGEIEKQPEGDAYNAMKWRGKTHSTRDEDQENERARNVMAYRKVLRARKKAKKKK